jgi:hypothetical protein
MNTGQLHNHVVGSIRLYDLYSIYKIKRGYLCFCKTEIASGICIPISLLSPPFSASWRIRRASIIKLLH